MAATIGLATLAFFISMGIGFWLLVTFGRDYFSGYNFVFLVYYAPIALIGSGIVFTLPVYFLLKQLPFVIQRFGKLLALLIIILVIILGLFILPK